MSQSDVPTLEQLAREKQSLLRDLRALEAPLNQAISQEKSSLNNKLHQIKFQKPNLIEKIINLAIKILGLTDLKVTLEKNEVLRKKQKLLEEYRDNVQKHRLSYKIQNLQNNEPRERLRLQIQTIDRTIHFLEKQEILRGKYYQAQEKGIEKTNLAPKPSTHKPVQPIIDRFQRLPESPTSTAHSLSSDPKSPSPPTKPPKNPKKGRNKS